MSVPAPRGPRLRELGLRIGRFDPGAANAITDVTGVTVGHATVWRDEPEPPEGRGIARTGVTAVLPASIETLHGEPVPAGIAVLNGAGELTGSLAIAEWGLLETPVYLTSTHAVGRVYDGAVEVAVAADPRVGSENFVIPVVGECDDSWLSEGRVVQIEAADVGRAVAAAAGGAVDEGAIGAGTGMMTKGYKAGIGTASRIAPSIGAAVGVLVLSNFYPPPRLVIDGVPVGEPLGEPPATRRPREAASPSSPSTHRCRRISSGASRAGRVSASRAVARSHTTAAARSSSRSPHPGGGHAERRQAQTCPTATSTTCSRQRSTRPRRRCSTRCGPRPRSQAAKAASAARSPTRTCSSSSPPTAASTPDGVSTSP